MRLLCSRGLGFKTRPETGGGRDVHKETPADSKPEIECHSRVSQVTIVKVGSLAKNGPDGESRSELRLASPQ